MRRCLLDTNHATLLADDAAPLLDRFHRVGGELFLCYPVIGEMWQSVFGGKKSTLNEANLHRIVAMTQPVAFDADAAREYGRLRHLLGRRGRQMPQVDIQVMAIAVVHGLTILTGDAHFRNVPGVAVENWLA